MNRVTFSPRGQARPAKSLPLREGAFSAISDTEITWLGSASVLINSRGTTFLIDPVLEGLALPPMFDLPVRAEDIPSLDAGLLTHIDDDHYSPETCLALKSACGRWHAPTYVAEEMRAIGLSAEGHEPGDCFQVGDVRVQTLPTDHCWQRDMPSFQYRTWRDEDCIGYWLETPDGSIYLPGDSRLTEAQLRMPHPDILLLDFSDDSWHIGMDNAVRLAEAHPEAELICIHWGTFDAPDRPPFNANPLPLLERVAPVERVRILFPGETFQYHRKAVRI